MTERIQQMVTLPRSVILDAIGRIPEGIVNCRGDKCRMHNCKACQDEPITNEAFLKEFRSYLKTMP